jgi:hypothetical protein
MEPFVAVRGRMQKDGETINVIAFEVRALRLGNGVRPPAASEVEAAQSRAGSSPGDKERPFVNEEELFPSLPGTQEWWPDRGKFKEGDAAQEVAADGSSGRPDQDKRERRRQEAQEDAATERRKEARRTPKPPQRKTPVPERRDMAGNPDLPKVREWWGKPEEARKSPFYYLTALRQSPPGTKSWG